MHTITIEYDVDRIVRKGGENDENIVKRREDY